MDVSFNIVTFIETNPVAKLSNTYNNKLLSKIKEKFNETQQQLFISSFYTYLNYHPTNDFVIDLDDVWKWLGFNQKFNAKRTMEKHFVVNIDYKILTIQPEEQKKRQHGGNNKDTIMLNINTFKLFCIKAGTSKANEIHDYFVKLEGLLHETIHEECVELKQQLENQVINSQHQQDVLREQTILKQFPANTKCVYYGKIDNKNSHGGPLIKFGNSNFLQDRVKKHKNTYDNFYLLNAYKVENSIQIENAMKYHPLLSTIRQPFKIGDTVYTEILNMTDLSYTELDSIITTIIEKIEYSPENYAALLAKNDKLIKRICTLKKELEKANQKNRIFGQGVESILTTNSVRDPPLGVSTLEHLRSASEARNLHPSGAECSEEGDRRSPDEFGAVQDEDDEQEEETEPEEKEEHEPSDIITFKNIRKFNRAKDGKYYINGLVYDKLFGNREEVWNGTAYETQGLLVKDDLMISTSINFNGKIVSKAKHHFESKYHKNRFSKAT
jgi:phage anti-repressor protein